MSVRLGGRWSELNLGREEFKDIYEIYANQVKKFLLCLSADVELAEELTQETFYQAVKSIERYDGSCKLSVWLCQIAKHLFYDYLKKQKNYPKVSVEALMKASVEIPSTEKNPEEQFINKEKMEMISGYIQDMKEPYQEIFLLRVTNDLSFREIGESFNKSENWARVTYYRAKSQLKERIQGDQVEM